MVLSSSSSTSASSTPFFTSARASRQAASSTPSTSTSGSRAPLSELSLAPFIFAAHNAQNIASNESPRSSPLSKQHGPSPILKPTSMSKKRTPAKSAVASSSRGGLSQDLDTEGDVTITSNGSSKSGRYSQPLTPPHHSTTPKNLRPHHPHVYSSNTSPLVTGNASPSLRRGVESPLKKVTHGSPYQNDATTPSSYRASPVGSMDPVAAKGGSSSLPRKRHRVQSGEAELAREEADRPLVGTPTPHKNAAAAAKGGSSARKREKSRTMVVDDASDQEARLQLSAEEENPFMARDNGGFVVFEDVGDDMPLLSMEKQTSVQADGDEDKENIRLMPVPAQASPSTMTPPTSQPQQTTSPSTSRRPSAAPLQRATAADNRAHGRLAANAKGKYTTSSTLVTTGSSSSNSGSGSSSEEGSSFFASSSSSSASGAEGESGLGLPRLLSRSSRKAGRDLPPTQTRMLGRRAREGSAEVGSADSAAGAGDERPEGEEEGEGEREWRKSKTPRRKGTGGRLSLLASAEAEAEADG
ncbi:hypothetical protein BCV69DRAFT_283333 [Microstroma glucosiphilum]|uniref:Uncharacterized protein n=1 Tax=Pseudomicrostroma glucosiphilum TaxID=1684307 RepID=A0A316U5C5_9BASI|nr:hypothetical protein BCV69DRAFT_283333 [Pseudomicrostroma glucosiphilum]PWN20452.1 hypothetical protein BCV69DRAFT_283333 [Pseudomicrostroma glucosiphilum]